MTLTFSREEDIERYDMLLKKAKSIYESEFSATILVRALEKLLEHHNKLVEASEDYAAATVAPAADTSLIVCDKDELYEMLTRVEDHAHECQQKHYGKSNFEKWCKSAFVTKLSFRKQN